MSLGRFELTELEKKRNVLDHHELYVHVTGASHRDAILVGGLDPAHAQNVCHITGETVLNYAPMDALGLILREIGPTQDEAELFVVIVRTATLSEGHAFPDTTHLELAQLGDTAAALEQSLEERNRLAYRQLVVPALFAGTFIVPNLFNMNVGPADQA